MKYCHLILLFFLFPFFCKSQDTAFVNTYGGNGYDNGFGIDTLKNNNVIVFGNTSSYGHGSTDLLVFGLNTNGKSRWERYFGTPDIDEGRSFCRTYDNAYVICGFTNRNTSKTYDVWVIKIDSTGNLIWEKTFGTDDWDFANGICELGNHNLAICGETYHNSTKGDAFIMELAESGDSLWWNQYGGPNNDVGTAIININSDLYVVGKTKSSVHPNNFNSFILKANANTGSEIWEKTNDDTTENIFNSIVQYAHDSLIVVGTRFNASSRYTEGTIAYYDASGTKLLETILAASNNFTLNKVKIDKKREIVSIGTTDNPNLSGNNDVILFFLDKNMSYVNGPTYGGLENDYGFDFVELSASHQMELCGTSYSFGNTLPAVLVVKTDTNYRMNYVFQNFSLSINNFLKNTELTIFPNPATDFLSIRTNSAVDYNYLIYNSLGEICISGSVFNEPLKNISLENLRTGIYFIELVSTNFCERRKIVVKK